MSEPPPPPPPSQPPPPPPPAGPGGYPGGAYPVPAKNSPLAIISLVLGIIGVLPCCWGTFVLGIAAAVTGYIGRNQIDAAPGQQKGRGMAVAGLVLGVVAIALGAIYWILVATGVLDINVYRGDFRTAP